MSNLIINANSIYDRIIKIGRQTENLVSSITFNVQMWIDEYGAGECALNVRRNGDGSAYPVPMTIDDAMTTWTITDTDTSKKGRGEIQLVYRAGDKVKTSPIFTISCGESLIGDGEPPSGYEDWFTELNRMTAQVEAAKTSADQSAQTAQTAAGTATTKATEAERSANTASGFAVNASASAQSASVSAQAAAQSAEQAASSASDVGASAQAASQSAQSAESAKQAAQTAESNAQGFAQTASEKASQAAESAANAAESVTDAQAEVTRASAEADRARAEAEQAASRIYDFLPTDNTSGPVASFTDGADNVPLKSLVVGINPVQSGNGDPSPDNVRPITGWTGANITTCGKNILMNTARPHTTNSVAYNTNADGSITANGTATNGNGRCDVININNPSKALLDMFSGKKLAGCPEGGTYNTYIVQLIIDGAVVCRDYGNGVQIPDLSQYYGASNLYVDASVRANYTAKNLVFKPMISDDATYGAYKPYSGESLAVAFPTEAGTVYGGSLDVVSGVLTVDRVKETFVFNNHTEDGTYNLESQRFNLTNRSTGASNSTGKITNVCGAYAYAQANWHDGDPHFYVSVTSCTLYLTKNTYRGGNVELCYPLGTPFTYQLTPTEVKTMFGINNIYADCGNVSVEYRADTTMYINRKIAEAISALA